MSDEDIKQTVAEAVKAELAKEGNGVVKGFRTRLRETGSIGRFVDDHMLRSVGYMILIAFSKAAIAVIVTCTQVGGCDIAEFPVVLREELQIAAQSIEETPPSDLVTPTGE